jgi:hypothetical protein
VLLRFVDALVRRDSAPAGFPGLVCLGVEHSSGAREWWQAELRGPAMIGGRVETPSADADACLLLGADEALAILKRGRLPAKSTRVWLRGDAGLVERFFQRIAGRKSWLGMRVQESATTPAPTRTRARRARAPT